MTQITDFLFNNIVLYAKGWYERHDIVEDLTYLFREIYYLTNEENEESVSFMMLIVLDTLCENFRDTDKWFLKHARLQQEIVQQMHLSHCSRELATIYVVIGILQELTNKEIKLKRPIYGKKQHFRQGILLGKYPISRTYKQMNQLAIKVFGE